MTRICGVTGASGYVGSRVARCLVGRGWTLRTLGRSGADIAFDLGDPATPANLTGLDALVHLSYDFSCREWDDIRRVNVDGSSRLFDRARAAGVGSVVAVSTVAAFPGARSRYGQAKLQIEAAAHANGGCVVRPGLVWGPEGGAMFGQLTRAVRALPIVPLPAPRDLPLLMAHEDDLGELIATALERGPELAGQLLVGGSPHTITFAQLLTSLAPEGRHPRLLPFPWRSAWLGLKALELAGVDPPFRSDSLVSLVAVDPSPLTRATVTNESLGVSFRPYPG